VAREVTVVRANERQAVQRGGSAFGYDYVGLALKRAHKRMDPFIFTFPPRIDRHVFFEHRGEEFLFVLSGTVEFQVGDERFTLRRGDSIYFDASVPHRGRSVGAQAKALVVIHDTAKG
jgi:mannose-6-phosphate isomerase-like protein (cupin superfamily)